METVVMILCNNVSPISFYVWWYLNWLATESLVCQICYSFWDLGILCPYQRKLLVGFRYGSFGLLFCLFYNKVWYLQHAVLMLKDCKLASFGGFFPLIFFQWVLYLFTSGEWIFGSSKLCLARVFVGVSFLFFVFTVWSSNFGRWTFEGRRRPI